MSDFIILICTIAGTVIAYLAYKASTTDALKETRTIALEKLDFLGRLNDQLISDLTDFGLKHNSFSEIFMQGLTLRQCIDLLKKGKDQIITKVSEEAIQKSKSKMRLDEIIKHLGTQIKHHSEVRTAFDYYIRDQI